MITHLSYLCSCIFFVELNSLRIGMQHTKQEKRVALVLRGDSFRVGLQQWSRDNSCSLDGQLTCSGAQREFIADALRRKGVKVDVFLSTYHTDAVRENGLLNFWNSTGDLVFNGWCDDSPSQGGCIRKALDGLHSHMERLDFSYNLIILTRHDVVPKDQTIANAALEHLDNEKIWLAPFKMTHNFRWFEDRVPDTIQIFTPNILPHMIELVKDKNDGNDWPRENVWQELEPHVGRDHMGFIMNFFGDSDPMKAMNPMYSFCQRTEGREADQWIRKRTSESGRAWQMDSEALRTFNFDSGPLYLNTTSNGIMPNSCPCCT